MSQMYLASEIDVVAKHIAKKIGDVSKLKAAFIFTAGELEKDKTWIDLNRKGLKDAGFSTFDYTLTGKTAEQLEKDLADCDLIHVNGGNTFYLLLQMRKCGFVQFIKKQIAKGVIYMGSSAGSLVAAPDIAIASTIEGETYASQLGTFEGLGLVDFIAFPHWGTEDFKELYLNRRFEMAYKPENKIILLNDYQYVAVTEQKYEIIDIRKD